LSRFAERALVHDEAREQAVRHVLHEVSARGIERIRVNAADAHGQLRGKTLTPRALESALRDGIGFVSTLLLKDSSDRTAYAVFEPGGADALGQGFACAANLVLLPDPASLTLLPWSPGTAMLRGQLWHGDGRPVAIDTRRILQAALARLADRGLALCCGLELEFHIYRLLDARLDPAQADWPGPAPEVAMIHPGYHLLADDWMDRAEEPLLIVQRTAQALGLPLTSLEIELGPSQVEAVFAAQDALVAADAMVLFRHATRQALRRAGYHATFMCRPPFAHIMSSGWHLHQSLVDATSGANRFMRASAAPGADPDDARALLSDLGAHYLAGLLAHAPGGAVFATATANGFGRFRPNAMAPQAIVWGSDNRGAMLRVIGGPGDAATRIENRAGEPLANPYLYFAAQIHAGLDGIERGLPPPPANHTPYASGAEQLPTTLDAALDALAADEVLQRAFGPDFCRYYDQIKRSEARRARAAGETADFMAREYFGRY